MNQLRRLSFGDESVVNVLRSNGRSKHPEDINILEVFYNKYQKTPSLYKFEIEDNDYYHWDMLYNNLKDIFPNMEEYFKDEVSSLTKDLKYLKQQTLILREGLLLQLEGTIARDMFMESHTLDDTDNVVTFSLFLVGDEITEEEDKKLKESFKLSTIKEKETVTIGMVSFDEGNFYVKDFDIKDKIYELQLLDMHYGEGFEEFNDKLINRLLNEQKGLTLFHGDPGTGKTTFIRHLIKKIKLNDKYNNILYFPPTMVGSITEPGFINFISEWVSDSKGKNYLLIEDAEPLLESRNQSRNIGITNLLNLTDGILNDVLSIQIIATFNTNLKNVDVALLRPERLLARKEFKFLSEDKGKKLAEKIGVKVDLIKGEMSLADIYSMKKESKPLTHDIDDDVKRISFD
jgi:hypothetical protein